MINEQRGKSLIAWFSYLTLIMNQKRNIQSNRALGYSKTLTIFGFQAKCLPYIGETMFGIKSQTIPSVWHQYLQYLHPYSTTNNLYIYNLIKNKVPLISLTHLNLKVQILNCSCSKIFFYFIHVGTSFALDIFIFL